MIHIKYIDEPDFGCEGVPENKPICDRITFVEADNEIVLEIPQAVVWQTKIDEGMIITADLFERLKKASIK